MSPGTTKLQVVVSHLTCELGIKLGPLEELSVCALSYEAISGHTFTLKFSSLRRNHMSPQLASNSRCSRFRHLSPDAPSDTFHLLILEVPQVPVSGGL